jgi:hypothetical protein
MVQRLVVSLVISFILRQVGKFKSDTDWRKIKADLDKRVRDLLPGTWLDDEGVLLCRSIVEVAQVVLSSDDKLQRVLELIADSKWDAAFAVLKDLILGQFKLQASLSSVLED